MTSFSKTNGDIDNRWDILQAAFCDSRNVFVGLIGLIGPMEKTRLIENKRAYAKGPVVFGHKPKLEQNGHGNVHFQLAAASATASPIVLYAGFSPWPRSPMHPSCWFCALTTSPGNVTRNDTGATHHRKYRISWYRPLMSITVTSLRLSVTKACGPVDWPGRQSC